MLSDVPLIEGLEATKATAAEIHAALGRGRETEARLGRVRECYRAVAAEAAGLFFAALALAAVEPIYTSSLEAFTRVFLQVFILFSSGSFCSH